MALSVMLGLSTFVMVWLIQPYMQARSVPPAWFGPIWAAANLWLAGVSLASARVVEALGVRAALLGCCLLIPLGYAGLAASPAAWATAFYLCFMTLRGLRRPGRASATPGGSRRRCQGLEHSDDGLAAAGIAPRLPQQIHRLRPGEIPPRRDLPGGPVPRSSQSAVTLSSDGGADRAFPLCLIEEDRCHVDERGLLAVWKGSHANGGRAPRGVARHRGLRLRRLSDVARALDAQIPEPDGGRTPDPLIADPVAAARCERYPCGHPGWHGKWPARHRNAVAW
jgi:hypothetical protein